MGVTKRQRKNCSPAKAGSGKVPALPANPHRGPPTEKPISIEMFFSDHDGDRAKSLAGLRKSMVSLSSTGDIPEVDWVFVDHRNTKFFFAHFSGDYIPRRMSERNQFYEAPFLNLLDRLNETGKVIIDGGANIGNHSVFFAGVMRASVIAFEPQPFNFAFLRANVCLNRLERQIHVRNIAIGDQPGHIDLEQLQPGNYGSFSADSDLLSSAPTGRSLEKFNARVSTLDDELSDMLDRISIIKLDLEGMELAALHGARRIIAQSTPVVAVECFTRTVYQKVKEFLAAFDYFVVDSTNATPTFIFLSRRNPCHQELLSQYLELSSLGKFESNNSFNER